MKRATLIPRTQAALRDAFWEQHPQFASLRRARKRQNDYPTDVRVAWCDFIEHCSRDGQISEALAGRATL